MQKYESCLVNYLQKERQYKILRINQNKYFHKRRADYKDREMRFCSHITEVKTRNVLATVSCGHDNYLMMAPPAQALYYK